MMASSLRNDNRRSVVVSLRNATLDDLPLLQQWDQADHLQSSNMGDCDYNDWNWEYELPRNQHLSWRYQLIAQVQQVVGDEQQPKAAAASTTTTTTTTTQNPIGFVQIIDPATEETHYWGNNCSSTQRAVDIWIGEPAYLNQGYGTAVMQQVLRDYCFSANLQPQVQQVLVDPLADNVAAHRFYQRLGFAPDGIRHFGPDCCLVHQLTRERWLEMVAGCS